jgi:hypothetical protein
VERQVRVREDALTPVQLGYLVGHKGTLGHLIVVIKGVRTLRLREGIVYII